MENFAYIELNRSCRFKDQSKLKTLGPWAIALALIIIGTQSNRLDISKYDTSKQNDLWRGGGMTQEQINEYKKMVQGSWSHWYQMNFKGKQDWINLHGFTSCSLDKSAAMSFAWENKETGHSKVLIHIKFNKNIDSYLVDTGAYDHEDEVLIFDGIALRVVSVEDIKDLYGKKLYTLIILKTKHAQ